MEIEAGKGQNKHYRIGPMAPSEYAFLRIMQDRGCHLRYVGFTTCQLFRLDGTSYTPDFQDLDDPALYYEVVGTRQAFHANKHKYAEFRERYPNLTLMIVKPDGSPVEVSA